MGRLFKENKNHGLGMVVHACNPSQQESYIGGLKSEVGPRLLKT
jgi:hypothetical protein